MTRRAGTAAFWLLAALLFARLALHALSEAGRPTHGFAAYWTSARLLLEGHPVARFYDERWFADRVEERIPGVRDGFVPNPPTLALMVLPVAPLPYGTARAAFLALGLLLLGATLALLVRELRPDPLLAAALVAFAAVCRPVRANLAYAQTYLLLVFLVALAFVAARRRRDALFGVALAVLLMLKLAGVLLWAWPLGARRYRALAWAAGSAACVFLVSLPWIHWSAWRRFGALLPSAGNPAIAWLPNYQSQTGLLRHLFARQPELSPRPLLDAPVLAAGLGLLAGLAVLVLALRSGVRDGRAVAALAVAGLLVTPLSAETHWALALPAFAILVCEASESRSVGRAVVLVLAMALYALAPERAPVRAEGLETFLAYPFVLSGWLLLSLLATRTRRTTAPSTAG